MKDFKKELKELLKKHDAVIMFECNDCSDLNSVYDEKLVVMLGNNDKQVLLSEGYRLRFNDL